MKKIFSLFIVAAVFTANFAQAATKQEVLELAISQIIQISINFIAVPGSGNDNYYFNSWEDADGYFFSEYVDPNDGLVKLKNIEVGGYTVTWDAYPSAGRMRFDPYTQDIVISNDKTAVLKQPDFELKDKQWYGITIPMPDGQYDRFSIVSCDGQTLVDNISYPSINVATNSVYLYFEADLDVECIKVVTNNYNGPNTISEAIEISPLETYDWNWEPNPALVWEEIDTGAEYGEVVLEGPPTFSTDEEIITGDDISSVSLREDIDSSIVIAGTENVPVLNIEFEALESYMLTELVLITRSGNMATSAINETAITQVNTEYLYDLQNNTETNIPNNGITTLSVLSAITAGNSKTLYIYADFNSNNYAVSSGDEVYFELKSYKYIDQNEIEHEVEVNLVSDAKKVVYFNVPTVTANSGSTTYLGTSDNEIMDITVSAGNSYNDIGINSLAVQVDIVDYNKDDLLSIFSIELLNEYGDTITFGIASQVDEKTIYTFFTKNKPNSVITGGTSETYTVNVNLSGVSADDSCRVTLVEDNFSWSDSEDSSITTNTDLINDLSGSVEISK